MLIRELRARAYHYPELADPERRPAEHVRRQDDEGRGTRPGSPTFSSTCQ